jgi:hypothetical protein
MNIPPLVGSPDGCTHAKPQTSRFAAWQLNLGTWRRGRQSSGVFLAEPRRPLTSSSGHTAQNVALDAR